MMGEEGTANAKTGVFSHLFDWNRKSRKKLFANGSSSSGEKKQSRGRDDNLSSSGFSMHYNYGDDARGGACSVKARSEYSSGYSVVDEEEFGRRAPGLVARLMGLDSLPAPRDTLPHSPPLLAHGSLNAGLQHQDSNLNLKADVSSRFIGVPSDLDLCLRKPPELKCRKMPSSPVEKFGMEVLPPQSARSFQLSQSKLLSPMRNPRFISPENAADIMEAAAKMYELGIKRDLSLMARMGGSFSLPFKDCETGPLDLTNPQSLPETSQKPTGASARRKLGDEYFNRSWNASESVATSSGPHSPSSAGGKTKGKSIAVIVEAKVNVPKKTSQGIKKSLVIETEHDDISRNQRYRKLQNMQQKKTAKRVCAPSTSGILRLNNQKQNCATNKGKLPTVPSSSSSSDRKLTKAVNEDTRQMRNKPSNALQDASKYQASKGTSKVRKEPTSSTSIKNPRYKRLPDAEVKADRMLGNSSLVRHGKHIQSSIVIDERVNKSSKKSITDVVSFTFTSPVMKPTPENWSPNKTVARSDKSGNSFDVCWNGSPTSAKKKALLAIGVNVIRNGSVSNSIENAIHELTVGSEPALSSGSRTSLEASSSLGSWLAASESSSAPLAANVGSFSCCGDKNSSISLTKPSYQPDAHNSVFQEQGGENLRGRDINNEAEDCDQLQPSPFSILEACFSGESCESSESCSSITGQDQDGTDSALLKEFPFTENERDVPEESYSTLGRTVYEENVNAVTGDCADSGEEEINYVKDILSFAAFHTIESILANQNTVLDPHIYDQLEVKKTWSESSKDTGSSSLGRKLLFDCVGECLHLRYHRQLGVAFRSVVKGTEVQREDRIAEEIYKEIMVWRSMESWMVDELVDRDFCRHLGRCDDLGTDAFEIGAEIQEALLEVLIDEAVAGFMVRETNNVVSSSPFWSQEEQADFQDYCLYCL